MKDTDAINVATKKPVFVEFYTDVDGETKQRYCDSQSTSVNFPCGVIGAKEYDAVVHGPLKSIVDFGKRQESEGLPANGGEPAIKPCTLLGCGNMVYQRKRYGSGGTCKVMKHFFHMCKFCGDDDIFLYITGDGRCCLWQANEKE